MKAGSFEKKDFCFNLRFPGQYYDSETGFYYNFHRYYMPEVGRYLRGDEVKGDDNLYFYVEDNPVSFWDIYGLCSNGSGGGNLGGGYSYKWWVYGPWYGVKVGISFNISPPEKCMCEKKFGKGYHDNWIQLKKEGDGKFAPDIFGYNPYGGINPRLFAPSNPTYYETDVDVGTNLGALSDSPGWPEGRWEDITLFTCHVCINRDLKIVRILRCFKEVVRGLEKIVLLLTYILKVLVVVLGRYGMIIIPPGFLSKSCERRENEKVFFSNYASYNGFIDRYWFLRKKGESG